MATIDIACNQPPPDEHQAVEFGQYFVDRGHGPEYAHLLCERSVLVVWFECGGIGDKAKLMRG